MPVPAILLMLAGLAFFFAAYWTWSRGTMEASRRKLLAITQFFAGFVALLSGLTQAGLI